MENSKLKPSFFDIVKKAAHEKPREESFKDTLKDLAESSSLHGIPKIVSSRQIAVKVLWCLLFIATASVLTYQLYNLFRTYYSYPIQTSVSLEFSAIPYPAISICNMNPVRKSKLEQVKSLEKLINKIPDDSYVRKRREALKQPLNEDIHQWEQFEQLSKELYKDNIAQKNKKAKTSFTEDVENEDYLESEVYDLAGFNIPDQWPETDDDNKLGLNKEGIIRPTHVQEQIDDQQVGEEMTMMEDVGRRKRAASSVSPSVIPSSMSSSSYYSSSWWYSDYYYNYNYGGGSNLDWDQIYKLTSSKKDVWEQRVEDVKTVFRNTSLKRREEIGHQKEDLFVSVTFAAQTQKVSRFKNFSSNDYGNCYTVTGPKFIAWRSGPSNGFKFTLNLEVDEYIKNFTTGFGLRVVFHEPGTQPLPSQDGITLSPGTETNIGLKTVKISRLGEPHGHCDEGDDFQKQYKMKYSLTACYEFCRIKATVDVCSCLLPDAPDGLSFNSTFVPVCNSSTSSASHKCVFDLSIEFNNGGYDCECREPCNEYVYTKTMSSRYWPTDEYLGILLDEICSTQNNSVIWSETCANLDNLSYYETTSIRNNFVRALIYFEDLNYEQITEEPLYEGVRFLSDIGGAMGLFLGASVLSMVEVAQLVLEIFLHLRHKYCNKNKTRVTSLDNKS
ncbi:amiloride-sensitive sodium channel [Mactra antiquata]